MSQAQVLGPEDLATQLVVVQAIEALLSDLYEESLRRPIPPIQSPYELALMDFINRSWSIILRSNWF